MSQRIPPDFTAGFDWRDHLRDRIKQADEVLASLSAYRTALAMELELGSFVAVAEPADIAQVKEMISALLQTMEMDKIWEMLK